MIVKSAKDLTKFDVNAEVAAELYKMLCADPRSLATFGWGNLRDIAKHPGSMCHAAMSYAAEDWNIFVNRFQDDRPARIEAIREMTDPKTSPWKLITDSGKLHWVHDEAGDPVGFAYDCRKINRDEALTLANMCIGLRAFSEFGSVFDYYQKAREADIVPNQAYLYAKYKVHSDANWHVCIADPSFRFANSDPDLALKEGDVKNPWRRCIYSNFMWIDRKVKRWEPFKKAVNKDDFNTIKEFFNNA